MISTRFTFKTEAIILVAVSLLVPAVAFLLSRLVTVFVRLLA
jgi:hypothetical protein